MELWRGEEMKCNRCIDFGMVPTVVNGDPFAEFCTCQLGKDRLKKTQRNDQRVSL